MILSKAILAGGCFWKLQQAFENKEGIISTQGGYIGGCVPNPTYMEISGGRTGHIEALEIIYDSQTISYATLLDIFFESHNPTLQTSTQEKTENQYRSAIFYTSEQQKQEALTKITKLQLSQKYFSPITTELIPAGTFYPAAGHISAQLANEIKKHSFRR